jgi:acetyltransferase-like isoleucine patch superfamily enzyme
LNHPHNYGSEPWLIDIGNKVTVTYGVFFLTHDASSRLFRDSLAGSSVFGNRFGQIQVKDNCFIGVNSIILPGTTIGPNSIIGAGSVVAKDVPPNTVVAGVPAREISSLDSYIEKYQERMIPIDADNREDLRKELTQYFWGEER